MSEPAARGYSRPLGRPAGESIVSTPSWRCGPDGKARGRRRCPALRRDPEGLTRDRASGTSSTSWTAATRCGGGGHAARSAVAAGTVPADRRGAGQRGQATQMVAAPRGPALLHQTQAGPLVRPAAARHGAGHGRIPRLLGPRDVHRRAHPVDRAGRPGDLGEADGRRRHAQRRQPEVGTGLAHPVHSSRSRCRRGADGLRPRQATGRRESSLPRGAVRRTGRPRRHDRGLGGQRRRRHRNDPGVPGRGAGFACRQRRRGHLGREPRALQQLRALGQRVADRHRDQPHAADARLEPETASRSGAAPRFPRR